MTTLIPTDQPTVTKRIGEYDPTTGQYPAFVAIDGEGEQLVGIRWTAGAADQACDEYIFDYFIDRHTPEAAAQIAAAFEPEPTCSFPGCPNPAATTGLSGWPVCDTCFRRSIAIHKAETSTRQSEDAICAVLFELLLTDAPAAIELLRGHTDRQRRQLAWCYAAWLKKHHGIVREPSFLLRGWSALLIGASASGAPQLS